MGTLLSLSLSEPRRKTLKRWKAENRTGLHQVRCWDRREHATAPPLRAERGEAEEVVSVSSRERLHQGTDINPKTTPPPQSLHSSLPILSQNWNADRKVRQNYFGFADSPPRLGHTPAIPAAPVPLRAGVMIVQSTRCRKKTVKSIRLKVMMLSDLSI